MADGRFAAALRIIRALLGSDGCFCKPRDRKRTADGHTIPCYRARALLARYEPVDETRPRR